MDYVDTVLEEFRGQISINDIYHMTYKEMGYLRKHRAKMIKDRGPRLGDMTV